MNQNPSTLAGAWHCRYWFPSNNHDGEDVSEYTGTITVKNNELVFESQPNTEKSYMFVRMTVEDDLVTGTWHEGTSPTGEFQGTMYSGALQVLREADDTRLAGKWVGIGQEAGKRQIYTGRWEFTRPAQI